MGFRVQRSLVVVVVVNHNQNTKYLKNSNPKYFIGSCLKNKRKL